MGAMTKSGQGASATNVTVPGQRYDDWLDVQRTVGNGLDSYRTENIIDFGCGWAELQRFSWSSPLESVWHTAERCYFLSLALDGAERTERRNMALPPMRTSGGKRVLLVPPGQTIHSVSKGQGERRTMRCLIDAAFVESICSHSPTPEERKKLSMIDFGGNTIEWLLLRMYREMSQSRIGLRIAVESIARAIAVEIARTIEQKRSESCWHAGGLPAWRMRLILDRIHADGPLPRLSELAEANGMTVRHLGRAFYADTGKTLGKFIAAAMAQRASDMLEADVPIGSVAAALGYGSSSSFAHAFRRETGLLPSEVRKQRRRRDA